MIDSLTFLYLVYYVAIVVLIGAAIIVGSVLIPLQMKEAGVKNGLLKLRKRMLHEMVILLILCVTSVAALSLRFFIDGEVAKYTTVVLVLIFALGLISLAINKVMMYREQYSDESKDLHAKVALEEKRNG